MLFFAISFLAGVLTVLAPCILPLLPVVIGSSATTRNRLSPFVIVGSLALSVLVFTYLLKASTAFISIPPEFWTLVSGGILLVFGLVLVFPALWERIPGMNRLSARSNMFLGAGHTRGSVLGDVIVGAALGPVFSTCSPTYFVILASVLPASFFLGTLYLLAYIAGLSLVLLLIAILGQRFADRLLWMADPHGWFKRGMGLLFIILGLLIATGIEKKIEAGILNSGFFDVTKIEQALLQQSQMPEASTGVRYTEIVDPSGFVNTDDITLGELVGKKVILVDFMTYSCINCQRTIPYLNAWYDAYKDQGLEIVAIHTPEFAFEKDIGNVRDAVERLGIHYPVVLDNDYATWRAYGNRYWPRKYLIDINGNVVYDHIGEGGYEETEKKIQELLTERAKVLGEAGTVDSGSLAASAVPEVTTEARSPETYFGSARNEYLANGIKRREGEQSFTAPTSMYLNALYLGGMWSITPEYAESRLHSSVFYRYNAKNVYLVMEAEVPTVLEVWQDGTLVKTITVQESTLYTLIDNTVPGEHVLELKPQDAGIRLFAFTFG